LGCVPGGAPSTAIQPAQTPAAVAPTAPVEINSPVAAPPAEPPTEQVAAKAGVGLQGQSLKEHSGVMVNAAKAYFNVRQRAVFEIQIPEALKLFKASEGEFPKTHDEFMAKIITANQINLPKLPAGAKYIYDPELGELMVERPAK